jgi:hypothetical protein
VFVASYGGHPRYANDIRGTAQFANIKRQKCVDKLMLGNVGYGDRLIYDCMTLNELDHIVPCCLYRRCDNSPANLQLQPWSKAEIKDKYIEVPTCREFHNGQISEATALSRFEREYP